MSPVSRDRPRQESRRSPSRRRQEEFPFRNRDDAPRYPPKTDTYRPQESNQRELPTSRYAGRYDEFGRRRKHHTRPSRGRWRGRANYKVATAERPLLRVRQDDEPEEMFGTTDEFSGTKRFMSADDMTDSEEELMEESKSEKDEGERVSSITSRVDTILGRTAGDSMEPPAKRRALGVKFSGLESEGNTPKWSNPDPYTVLPPLDDPHRKKRDVVKIIRRARVVSDKGIVQGGIPQSQVAANDDFISFGFEDEGSDTDEELPSPVLRNFRPSGPGVPGAPSGPGQFRRPNNFLDQGLERAPGSQSFYMTVEAMGPPPGLAAQGGAKFSIDKSDPDPKPSQDAVWASRNDIPAPKDKKNKLKRKRGARTRSAGSLIDDWAPDSDTECTPWLEHVSNRLSENPGFRLHKEICDFYEFVRPQKYEQIVRENLLERLQTSVRRELSCDIHSFGSFAAGLYLPNADMDLVVISDNFAKYGHPTACQSYHSMRKFASYLMDSHIAAEGSVEVISKAKVPLIKFVDRLTSIKVDMSFENYTGLSANETFVSWKSQFPAMPILVTLIKQFLMMRGLNEVVNGGLGGFSVTCLVTSLLQNMPRVQTGELVPENHLGEILMEFLDFYGNQIDISRTGIKMDPPGYFYKYDLRNSSNPKRAKPDRLAIMDPNLPDNDISGGSGNVMLIFDRFSEAHDRILEAMKIPNRRSLLEGAIGGNYEIFQWQRNHLRIFFNERCDGSELGPLFNGNCYNVHQQINIDPPLDSEVSLRPSFPIAVPILDPPDNRRGMKNYDPFTDLIKKARASSQQKKAESSLNLPPPKVANEGDRKKPRSPAAIRNKERADHLKMQHPDIKIPDSLSKAARTTLLRQILGPSKSQKSSRIKKAVKNLEVLSINNALQLD